MNYEKRNLMDSDSRLIMFTDVHEGVERNDTVVYVRFKYDLSEDQVYSIMDEAENIEYRGFLAFDDWVEAVIKKAMKHDCWKNVDNEWGFWFPCPCLEIEV